MGESVVSLKWDERNWFWFLWFLCLFVGCWFWFHSRCKFHTIPNPTLLCPFLVFPLFQFWNCFHWIKFPLMIKTVFRISISLLLKIMHARFPSVLFSVVLMFNKVAIIYKLCKKWFIISLSLNWYKAFVISATMITHKSPNH